MKYNRDDCDKRKRLRTAADTNDAPSTNSKALSHSTQQSQARQNVDMLKCMGQSGAYTAGAARWERPG